MGLFRPRRKVIAPDGREWEIYVTRLVLPEWSSEEVTTSTGYGDGLLSEIFVFVVIDLPKMVARQLVYPLLRALALFPATLLRARKGGVLTVDAVCFWPDRQGYRWTTTAEQIDKVTEEIASGLAKGRIDRPAGAEFHGAV
mgnify:CR=1 FL=1